MNVSRLLLCNNEVGFDINWQFMYKYNFQVKSSSGFFRPFNFVVLAIRCQSVMNVSISVSVCSTGMLPSRENQCLLQWEYWF